MGATLQLRWVGFSLLASPGLRAQYLWYTGLSPSGMWDLTRPETEPISPALAGGFLTTGPPGTSLYQVLILEVLRLCSSSKWFCPFQGFLFKLYNQFSSLPPLQKACWDSDWDVNLLIYLGKTNSLIILSLSIYEHSKSLILGLLTCFIVFSVEVMKTFC